MGAARSGAHFVVRAGWHGLHFGPRAARNAIQPFFASEFLYSAFVLEEEG
jgi:hypothetical protein